MYTDDVAYTNMRLQNTVVRDREAGKLVQIINITKMMERKRLRANVVTPDEDEEAYAVPLDQLDLSSPPLGNINHQGRAYYIVRVPKRNDWRQGLRKENLGFVYEGGLHSYQFGTLSILKEPIYNKYPPYKECLGQNFSAFSRTFSLDCDKNLWYKCRERVGKDVDGVPTLDEKHEWLKEALEDALKR